MGKKKISTTASVAASATGSKATAAVLKKTAPKVGTASAKDAQCDWTASTITKRDDKRMRSLGLISDDEEDVIFPGSDSRQSPRQIHCYVFRFPVLGVVSSSPRISLVSPFSYGIQLWHLMPNSILHLTIFIIVREAFLGINPQWDLWKKIFLVKRHNGVNRPYITGGVDFIVWKEVNYFNFPMKEFVHCWRSKWFYFKN
jgi:hypothetical protein